MSLRLVWLMVLLASGCRRASRPMTASESGDAPAPRDSLVTSNGRGAEVWLTLARAAKGPDGKPCVERGVEIRQRGARVPVPLLYTGEAPVILNDSTLRAVLWNNCSPADTYRVDLRSGRPVRERGRGAP
jgi:hypothetical protein